MNWREIIFWCIYVPLLSIAVYVVVLIIAECLNGICCNV